MPAAVSGPRQVPMGWLYLMTLIGGIGLWTLGAAMSANALVPAPQAVVAAAWQLIRDGTLWDNTIASLGRVVTGFLLGVALAIPAGFLMGWYRAWRAAWSNPGCSSCARCRRWR